MNQIIKKTKKIIASTLLFVMMFLSINIPTITYAVANTKIRQEVNITNSYMFAASSVYATSSAVVAITDENYQSPRYYFEVVASTTALTTASFSLVNATSSAVVATATLTGGSTSYGRFRSSAFMPNSSTTVEYKVVANNQAVGKGLIASRIVVLQNSGAENFNDNETQIEIGSATTSASNTSTLPLISPKYWYYDSTKWSPTPVFFVEASYKVTPVASSTTYTTAGAKTYVVSPNAGYTVIEAWGGGGSGFDGSNSGGGAGGGGGAYARSTTTQTVGASISMSVGAGGSGSAGAGGNTTFNTTVVVADGGEGGTDQTTGRGVAGSVAGSTGDVEFAGGLGGAGNGSDDGGGGGGGSGGPDGTGGNGSDASTTVGGGGGGGNGGGAGGQPTGGTSAFGGAGGNGGNGGVCTSGTSNAKGGGGAGGADQAGTACTAGAPGGGGGGAETTGPWNGAVGQIKLTEWIGTVGIALEESDGTGDGFQNFTFKKMVVVAGKTSTTTERVRSSFFTPTSGRNYRLVASTTNSTASYDIYNAKIVGVVGTTKLAFTTVGNEAWIVPNGITTVTVRAWGGGGGRGRNGNGTGGSGGGGGYVQANIAVTPGESLTMYVGGGGGAGTATVSSRGEGGGGGGYSAVTRSTTYLVQAGGGGGGGGGADSGGENGAAGGAGGGVDGVDGSNGAGSKAAGGGLKGTSTAGGAGGVGDGVLIDGSAGSENTGGAGGNNANGSGTGGSTGGVGGTNGGGAGGNAGAGAGGGGGGRFGGGGGEGGDPNSGGAGGGGGSDLVTGSNTTETAGSGTTPGASNGSDRSTYCPTAGAGSDTNLVDGSSGCIVITYRPGAITKTSTQYLLAPFKLPPGTSLQNFLTYWDSADWSTTNAYYHEVHSANASASIVELDTAAGVQVAGSVVTSPDNRGVSGCLTMPATGNLDMKATTNNNDVHASHVVVDVGSSACATNPTISSAANQTFANGQSSTAISTITITDHATTPAITAANDLRIAMATSSVSMLWDTSDTTATFGGTASGKVSNPVSYEGGGSVLVIPVGTDFSASDTLTISGLSFTTFDSANVTISGLDVYKDGANDITSDADDDKTITIKGTLVLSPHDAGTESNKFDTLATSVTSAELYSFKLVPTGETISVTNLILSLTGMRGMNTTDVTNSNLFIDYNLNSGIDAGDTQIGGTGAVSIFESTGTITFSTSFSATTTRNYLFRGDVANLSPYDAINIRLRPENITSSGATSAVSITSTGSTLVHTNHVKIYSDIPVIGGSAPAGAGVVSSGGSGGGEIIGNDDVLLLRPTSTGSVQNNWSTPTNAYDGTDGTYATETTAGQSQDYADFSFTVPAGNIIDGIAVKIEASGSSAVGTIEASLSWNGGTNVTSVKTTSTLSTTDTVYTLGGSGDKWGRTWSSTELSNTNFRLRITGQPSGNTINVDDIKVKVYHRAGGGGSGGGGDIGLVNRKNLLASIFTIFEYFSKIFSSR